ncbi:unnamed protein product [Rotaria sp. Silwood2]|nr:unnamed protein product [Rotaria sp. Silwood2]CAF3259303.1 unnamed protein product [Rotaria sp. Silwood2]CAF3979482.1 unnamed protein product [Rotaria sp. Silwood2]CAF4344974.1 unnamed protein product [Rotaria sp. Silwood2]
MEYDNNNQRMFMPHSVAATYLFRWPIRQYQNRFLVSTIDNPSLFISSDQNIPHEKQRMKRIYWENLAFHAADFNRKPKKI